MSGHHGYSWMLNQNEFDKKAEKISREVSDIRAHFTSAAEWMKDLEFDNKRLERLLRAEARWFEKAALGFQREPDEAWAIFAARAAAIREELGK